MAKIHDITVTITNELPVWPGDLEVSLRRNSKIEDGMESNVSSLCMSVHSGTHVDAPYHFLAEGKTIEMLSLEALIGPIQVVQVPENVDEITGDVIQMAEIRPGIERLLFKTRNSNFWPGNKFRTDFVGVDESGVKVLIEKKIRLVGIDYLSIAPYLIGRQVHELLLMHEIIPIEGCDLSRIEAGFYTLYALPMKLGGSDGAPVRAVLLED